MAEKDTTEWERQIWGEGGGVLPSPNEEWPLNANKEWRHRSLFSDSSEKERERGSIEINI